MHVRRTARLAAHLAPTPAAGEEAQQAQEPEAKLALIDSAEQRRLTGDAAGYRPEPLTPWAWDNELPIECIRWSFSRTRELSLTANIRRGATVAPLPHAPPGEQLDLSTLTFVAAEPAAGELEAGGTYSVQQMLDATTTDCFVVLHHGKIVYEAYQNEGQDERTKRLGMSMGKTCTSMLVGTLVAKGQIDPSKQLTDYIPELMGTGYEGVSTSAILTTS